MESTALNVPEDVLADNTRRMRSRGEKLFDDIVYTGINGFGTFFVTLFIAYELKFGRGKTHFDKAALKLENSLFSFIPQGQRHSFATHFLNTTALMQGGNAMLLPVGYLEHHKVRLVQGLNVMLGDTTDPATIQEAPQQTVGSLLLGRIRAFGAIFLAFTGMGILFSKQMHNFEKSVGRGFQAFRNHSDPGKAVVAQRLGELGALDVFATAAASVLMYDGSHKAAANRDRKEQKISAREQTEPSMDTNNSAPAEPALPSTLVRQTQYEHMLNQEAPALVAQRS